jgi:hypothetical protein
VLELIDLGSADECYGTACPSTTSNYPQPNYVLPIGSLSFVPGSIVPGTGISSINGDFTLVGDMEPIGGPPPFYSIDVSNTPTIFTGIDPGGTTAYVYFQNPDGTLTNVLHVTIGTSGGAALEGVLIDPPGSITFDVLGFINAGPNSTITAPLPEPGSGMLLLAAAAMLGGWAASRSRIARAA